MRITLALLLLPFPALAQEYLGDDLIDFERLLRENVDRVVETTDWKGEPARVLDLGDGQSITCSDRGCDGEGPNGGLGCEWEWLTIARGMAVACSAPPGPGLQTLEQVHGRVSAHVARNAYPPRSAAEVEGRYQRVIDDFRTWPEADQGESCKEQLSSDGMVGAMIETMSDPETVAAIDGRLVFPGLPFVGPCY